MENVVTLNIFMSLAITAIIVTMSIVKSQKIGFIIYGLPIPITLALIATQKGVDTSHIIGLCLLVGFLWLVYFLHNKANLKILLSIIISVMTYVSFGYVALRIFYLNSIKFFIAVFACLLFWIIVSVLIKKRPPKEKKQEISVFLKGIIVFCLAFLLLSAHSVLAGIVVTFPFSGVFAVYEKRDNLYCLADDFLKYSSIAILCFFVAIYLSISTLGFYLSIILGWIVFIAVNILTRKIISA